MRYTFDAYLLDTACYELYHTGTRVPVRPKVLEVLAYLVVHHDRVVSKQELLAQLWPNQVVGERAEGLYHGHAPGARGAGVGPTPPADRARARLSRGGTGEGGGPGRGAAS